MEKNKADAAEEFNREKKHRKFARYSSAIDTWGKKFSSRRITACLKDMWKSESTTPTLLHRILPHIRAVQLSEATSPRHSCSLSAGEPPAGLDAAQEAQQGESCAPRPLLLVVGCRPLCHSPGVARTEDRVRRESTA